MVIGGQAVLAHGFTRLTDDIDITLGVAPEQLSQIIDVILEAGLVSLVDDAFVAETLVLPCIDKETDVRVDLIFSFAGYEREALKRVQKIDVGAYSVGFASVEDVIIHKLVAGRPRDIEDVNQLLIRHAKTINRVYITGWLDSFSQLLGLELVTTFTRLLADASS